MKEAMFVTSADSKTLASVLNECEVGDVITYDVLNKSIGRDVRSDAKSAMICARKLVQRESQMVFDAVASIGFKRLSDDEIVDLSDKTRDQLRRATRRTVVKLHCVSYEEMSKEKQTKHNTALSMFGVIGELATEKSIARLQRAVESTQSLPTAKAALAALGGLA